MYFPVSGVECSPLLPVAVAFFVTALCASAGLSGAFLLLPFQMSVLGFVTPAVTPTNLLYNVIALPGGAWRYFREGRMTWPLTWIVLLGTLPGVFLGAFVRVRYLPDPRAAKFFVGAVLLYLGTRLLRRAQKKPAPPTQAVVTIRSVSAARVEYDFAGAAFAFRPPTVFLLSLVAGTVGGIYGIGGGAIIAPFVVAILKLPVHTVAGAAMVGTLVTSIAGAGFFHWMSVAPDWPLGALFGIGGLTGTYTGARMQCYLPERVIRLGLGVLVSGLAVAYIVQFFA